MAHFIRAVKVWKLKKKWKEYLLEKKYGLLTEEDESDSEISRERIFWYGKVRSKIRAPNAIERLFWESLLGFIGGVLLTYLLFVFFHIGVNIAPWTSTYACALVGIVLCLGLAFSSNVRCYVLLLLPVFFSKQGRQALLTYALFLSFTGPGKNTMHNLEILSDSMACGQEMVRRTLKQIVDLMKAPDKAVRENMHKVVKALQEIVDSISNFVVGINRIIISIIDVFKQVSKWLTSVVNLCNKKAGTPFRRCMEAFDEAIADCKARLGAVGFFCHVVHVVKALCYTVKWSDFFCLNTEFLSDDAVGTARKKLQEFHVSMKKLLSVSVEFIHSYTVEPTFTNIKKQVSRTILQKLSKKMEKLQTIFSFFGFVFSLFFVFLFVKVYYYMYKYFSSDRYDNFYINRYIIELDKQRAEMDRETVLPLESREKNYYAMPTSIRLVKNERSRISESLFLLGLTSFKILTFLVVDYSLFWILMLIYEAGRDAHYEADKSKITIHVEGAGILTNFYRKLGKTLQVPENSNLHLNRLHCLPDPIRPDTRRYVQIGFLVTLCWLLTMTEAYGLRLRHLVMSHYYPDRARERAVWLYNHIILSRSSFVRYTRRHLRKKFGGASPLTGRVAPSPRPFADLPVLAYILGRTNERNCWVCEAPESEPESLRRCMTPDCKGRYCLSCFSCLGNVCTVCQHPINYGDVSDVSEEIDSSEEDTCEGNYKSTGSESGGEYNEKSEEYLTFEQMEVRDRFRDVEANRLQDYVKLGDLYTDKAALQRRLKAVIQRHLESIERERTRVSEKKGFQYQHVRLRLKDAIFKLKSKKLEQIRNKKLKIKQKFTEKIHNLRILKEKKSVGNEEEIRPEGSTNRSKSGVSFKVDVEEQEISARSSEPDYVRLKKELEARIEFLKKRKSLKRCSLSFHQGKSLAT